MNRIALLCLTACGSVEERAFKGEGDPLRGALVFVELCADCHGRDASGGEGPSLRGKDDTPEELADKILYGWGAMEGFDGEISAKDLRDLLAYLVEDVQGG